MLLNEFSESHFTFHDERQNDLLEQLKQLRAKLGIPGRTEVMKALERTRPYTKTVYPKDWIQK